MKKNFLAVTLLLSSFGYMVASGEKTDDRTEEKTEITKVEITKAPVADAALPTKKIKHGTVIHPQSAAEVNDLIAGGAAVIKVSASWCPPCRALAPVVEAVAAEMKNISFIGIDIDEATKGNGGLGVFTADVQSLPTLKFYKNGTLVHTHVGGMNKGTFMNLCKQYLS